MERNSKNMYIGLISFCNGISTFVGYLLQKLSLQENTSESI